MASGGRGKKLASAKEMRNSQSGAEGRSESARIAVVEFAEHGSRSAIAPAALATEKRPTLYRQCYAGFKPAFRLVAEENLAAMGAQDVAGDGEAEAGAAGLAVPAGLQPAERFEGGFHELGGNAGAVILDVDLHLVFGQWAERDARGVAIFQRVADEVGERAFQAERAGVDGQMVGAGEGQSVGKVGVSIGGFVEDGAKQAGEVDAGDRPRWW